MTDPTNNSTDEATPDTSAPAEALPRARRRPGAVVPDAGPLNGARRTGRDGRRRGARARHVAQRWPLPAPRRGPLWWRWWVLVAVAAGASGALVTLGVLALTWPR